MGKDRCQHQNKKKKIKGSILTLGHVQNIPMILPRREGVILHPESTSSLPNIHTNGVFPPPVESGLLHNWDCKSHKSRKDSKSKSGPALKAEHSPGKHSAFACPSLPCVPVLALFLLCWHTQRLTGCFDPQHRGALRV